MSSQAQHPAHFRQRTLSAKGQSRAHPPSLERVGTSTARCNRHSRFRRAAACGKSPKVFEQCRSYGNRLIKRMDKRCKLPEKYSVRLLPTPEAAEDRQLKVVLINRKILRKVGFDAVQPLLLPFGKSLSGNNLEKCALDS